MKIIVPFTQQHPDQMRVLGETGFDVIALSMTDDESYWRLLKDIWSERETIVLVEHDILPWPGAIGELCVCPGVWCSYTYRINGGIGIHHGFGCTKISRHLMDLLPSVWNDIDDRNWHKLDSQLCHAALRVGMTPHPHRPPVLHLKPAA